MRTITLCSLVVLSGCATRAMTDGEKSAEKIVDASRQEAVSAVKTEQEKQRIQETATRQTEDARRSTMQQQDRAHDAQTQAIAQASSNLGPLTEIIATRGLVNVSRGITAQKIAIDTALNLPPAQYPAPLVSVEQFNADATRAILTYEDRARTLQGQLDTANTAVVAAQRAQQIAEDAAKQAAKDLDAARAAADAARAKEAAALQVQADLRKAADNAATWQLWSEIGMGALTALGGVAVLLLRSGAGGPIGGLLSNLIAPALVRGKEEAEEKLKVAHAAVAGADVGRSALASMQSILKNASPDAVGAITEAIRQATGGRAESMEQLFKVAAKAYLVDQGAGNAQKVDTLLNDIRDTKLDTQGGIPTAIRHIIQG